MAKWKADSEMNFRVLQISRPSPTLLSRSVIRGLPLVAFWAVLLLVFMPFPVLAQDEKTDKADGVKPTAENVAKAEQILARAIEVVGGSNYLT